jgi:hypothetical protein
MDLYRLQVHIANELGFMNIKLAAKLSLMPVLENLTLKNDNVML